MHVVIDARMLMEKLHGIARYLFEILKSWQKMDVDHRISLICNQPDILEKLGLDGAFECILARAIPFDPSEMVEIPSILKKTGADLFHAPSISVPPVEILPTIITVHDLIPLHMEGFLHVAYCQTILKRAISYARAIIVPSEFTKNDVVRSFNCPPGKVHRIYEAAASAPKEELVWSEIAQKFKIKKPYVFYLGNPKPHKNIPGLLEIYSILRESVDEKVYLVLGSRQTEEILYQIVHSPYREDIIQVDYFDEPELDLVYSNARVFAFPTYFEGFGLPPLEAMKRGCPVVSSNRASLPESVGEGGILVDPDDHLKFAGEIKKLVIDEDYWKKWSFQALKWQEKFSWERCARKTLDVYEKAVKDN